MKWFSKKQSATPKWPVSQSHSISGYTFYGDSKNCLKLIDRGEKSTLNPMRPIESFASIKKNISKKIVKFITCLNGGNTVKLKRYIPVFLILLSLASFKTQKELSPAKILGQMYDSIQNIKTLRLKVSAIERAENTFLSAGSELKLQVLPRRLYLFNKVKKLEVLYNQGEHNNKALVKPHVFPYITLVLDPTGNLMRKNQHYTINELGFEFIGKAIALTVSKDKDGIKNFSYNGKVIKNGHHCYFLEYENKNYGYTEYVVGEKETATSIARKIGVNDYLLRFKNKLLNDFGYLKKGTVLTVPILYCKKATLLIDEKLFLPISIALYDDVGIFENYEFSIIEINKAIKAEEFSRNYKDYNF
jgi:hypothetical protein